MQIIIALITLAICGGSLFWFKKNEEKKKFKKSYEEDELREQAAKQAAQDFVNAKDLGENCLYTLDDMIFSFIKIEGVSLELYSRAEQKQLCKKLSAALSQIRRPYKYIAVSRPVDISKSLQEYNELYASADGGRKKLLKNEMNELAEMVMSGETLERQHYIAVWDTTRRADEPAMVLAASELQRKFEENGIHADVLDKKGIVRLCNLVNIPAYVHIEDTDIADTISVLSDE